MIAGAELLPVLKPPRPSSTNPANEIAKKLTGRDYVSWSALSTFRTCPLKYKFRYVDGLPEESVSAALVFGSGIHSAIEEHFQAILAGDPRPDVDKLLFAYRSAWLPHDPDADMPTTARGARNFETWLAERDRRDHPVAGRVVEKVRLELRSRILSFASARSQCDM
jgi:hypothetical protein